MHYDVIIAGGGMIGTSLALALEPLGLRVAIVERVAPQASRQPSFDDRSTALSRSSQRMYTAMGLWDDIVASATPITKVHVSDQGRFGFSHIDAAEQKVEALGYVMINRVLGDTLRKRLAAVANLDMVCPATVAAVQTSPEEVRVTVRRAAGDTTTLRARLLIAADGAQSQLRDMLGIGVRHRDYRQRAIIGNLLPERPLQNCAYERFTEDGPLALLPVSDGRASFIWTVAEADAERVLGLDDDRFLAELQAAFGNRLGRLSRLGQRAAYPLQLSKALRLTAPRAVLLGNAAHGLHPVAAQGFNLGLRDVACLCDCISQYELDDPALLAAYADWRHSDQDKLVGFTDGLVQLFGSRRRSLRALRGLGMLGFDLVPGVRSLFARHTMGLAGHLPRLSRGVPLT